MIDDTVDFGVNENTPKNGGVNFGINENTPKNDIENFGVNETQKQILKFIYENPQVTAEELACKQLRATLRINLEY